MGKRTLPEVRIVSLICALWVVMSGWLAAQRLPDPSLQRRPANGLSDEKGVLGENSSVKRNIIELIRKLEEEHGYRLYVILERSFISADPYQLALRLQEEWLPHGGGLVVVFESDSRKTGFGRGLDKLKDSAENQAGIPPYEFINIVAKSMEVSNKAETSEDFIGKLVTALSVRISGYFERKKAPVDSGRSLRLALVTIGALSLLTLCGMGLAWMMGKADKGPSSSRVFPEVQIPERLGAPYAGGCGGSGYFGPDGREIK